MEKPLLIPLRPSARIAAVGTETGDTVRLRKSATELTVVLDVTDIADLTQAADVLDVYVDASNDEGTTWYNIGRFARVSGVDSAYATGTLTLSGAITPGVHALNVLTSDGTNPSDGDTLTVGAVVYRYKTTPAQAYDIQIGVDAAETLEFTKAAVNAESDPGPGTAYFAGTLVHPYVFAQGNTATTLNFYARIPGTASNALATTETSAHLSWADTTLGGGTGASTPGVAGETVTIGSQTYMFVDELTEVVASEGASMAAPIANQVKHGGSTAIALDNLKSAVNASAGGGTTYSASTTANASVSADTNTDTTQAFTADTIGTPGNSVATTETLANGSFGGATLSGGTYGPSADLKQILKWSAAVTESSQPVVVTSDLSNTSGDIRKIGFGNALRYRGIVAGGGTVDFTYSVQAVAK